MAPFDKSKRSVVKHKTRKPFAGGGGGGGAGDRGEGSSSGGSRGKPRSGGGGGFKVGPRHAPDGAYLGKAKRIKANLIANAKTKQRFYKSIKGKGKDDGGVRALEDTPESLGRFAPEAPSEPEGRGRRSRGGGEDDEGEDSRRRTSRAGPPPPGSDSEDEAEGSRRRRRDRAGPPPPPAPKGVKRGRDEKDAPAPSTAAPSRPAPRFASREEALAARKERQEKWNKASGSETGRRRGQPDLGSRMEVLLDKIRAT